MNVGKVDRILKSSLLREDVPFRVLLPERYTQTDIRFPTLYLLHGLFGSFENWTELTGLAEYAALHDLVIVMPEGQDRWYTDSPAGAAGESYLVRELIPEVDASFRTLTIRDARTIAGNSMGGYGAFKFALKYPDLFGLAGSFSGAFEGPRLTGASENANWNELGPSITKVFRETGSETRSENDLEKLLRGLKSEEIDRLPYFYFDCGSDDGFLKANEEMDAALASVGAAHEFRKVSGGHDWQYWDGRIEEFLVFADRRAKGLIPL